MVFSSYVFILGFLPIVLVGYYLLSHLENPLWQRLFLIVASLVFYGWFNWTYLILILASIAVNYVTALEIQNHSGRGSSFFLAAGILFNVGLIGYFKYYDFFVENINHLTGSAFALKHILLPLGISFYTFQQLSFLVSVYHREEKVERLRDYALFVTFFPQLVAGPIVLYSEMIPQFKDTERRYFCADHFAEGIYRFTYGLFKKVVLADTLAFFVDTGFSMDTPGMAAAWFVSLCYTFQIFLDFSGYSDMAIGLGKMFNIDIPMNFNHPYRSKSISEFWRRWHMTLGRALSTYIYKPLGGNRKGLARTCLNLFLTFFVSGLWHGAAWTSVLWGVLHGLFVIVERISGTQLNRIPGYIRSAFTFLIVNVLWVLFRADSFSQAFSMYSGMINIYNLNGIRSLLLDTGSIVSSLINLAVLFIGAVVLCLLQRQKDDRAAVISMKGSVTAALLFVVSFLCLSRESIFIYFNF